MIKQNGKTVTDPRQIEAYKLARKHLDLKEIPGAQDNAKIVQMFADVGHSWVKDDETAWCAAFMGSMLKRAGLPHTGKLNARSYLDWGEVVPIAEARRGDVVIFTRGDPNGWQGHVGFADHFESGRIWTLGGNQKNRVGIDPYSARRVLGVRRMTTQQQSGIVTLIKALLSMLQIRQ